VFVEHAEQVVLAAPDPPVMQAFRQARFDEGPMRGADHPQGCCGTPGRCERSEVSSREEQSVRAEGKKTWRSSPNLGHPKSPCGSLQKSLPVWTFRVRRVATFPLFPGLSIQLNSLSCVAPDHGVRAMRSFESSVWIDAAAERAAGFGRVRTEPDTPRRQRRGRRSPDRCICPIRHRVLRRGSVLVRRSRPSGSNVSIKCMPHAHGVRAGFVLPEGELTVADHSFSAVIEEVVET
jgi:hypothetical protein